jgi:hypothetical protein
MARPPALPRKPPSRRSGSEALAALLGHQLNNLIVPLDGFAELAMQNLEDPALLRQDLAEMRMAIGRIKQLALELESLGESDSHPNRVTIGACISPVADSIAAPWTVHWLCSASTPVAVDLLHAQRAIQSLARFAEVPGADDSPPPRISVSLGLPPAARCTTCGAPFDRKQKSVLIETQSARKLDGQSLREPFGRPFGKARGAAQSGGGRGLTLAVLVHCAHLAGGHLLLEAAGRRLGLALPGA